MTLPAPANEPHSHQPYGHSHHDRPQGQVWRRARSWRAWCLQSLLPPLALLVAGCASKADLEQAQAALADCQAQQQTLKDEETRWQQRFDRESERWQSIERSVNEAVPNALAEVDAEREQILALVPEQVQYEVGSYLDDYFSNLMSAFRQVQGDSRDIKLQLEATRSALAAIGEDTQQIGLAIDRSVAAEAAKRRTAADGLESLHRQLVAFARDRIDCRTCDDRIKLNRREREAILGFHARLIDAIAALQTEISR